MPIIPRVDVSGDIPVRTPEFGVPPKNPALLSAAQSGEQIAGVASALAKVVDEKRRINQQINFDNQLTAARTTRASHWATFEQTGTAPGAEHAQIAPADGGDQGDQ